MSRYALFNSNTARLEAMAAPCAVEGMFDA
jgi:hypothetical protein